MSAANLERVDLKRENAAYLWVKLRDGLAFTAATVREIVEKRAWEPLGYPSFLEAWQGEIGLDEPLSIGVAHAVVVQFALDGASDEQMLSLSGVGPSTVADAKRAARVGLDKPVVRRATTAELPGAARCISVEFEPEERARFARLAEANGTSVGREAEKAIRSWFDRIEKRLERR